MDVLMHIEMGRVRLDVFVELSLVQVMRILWIL